MLHIYYAKCGREERWVISFYHLFKINQRIKQIIILKVSGIISGLNAIVLDRAGHVFVNDIIILQGWQS